MRITISLLHLMSVVPVVHHYIVLCYINRRQYYKVSIFKIINTKQKPSVITLGFCDIQLNILRLTRTN